jgi:hypothetical protein
VQASSFTIRFPEHLPREKWEYCLDQLADSGGSAENIEPHVFRIHCLKPGDTAKVGWALFHTHFANVCTVLETSGDAENRASAYPSPARA